VAIRTTDCGRPGTSDGAVAGDGAKCRLPHIFRIFRRASKHCLRTKESSGLGKGAEEKLSAPGVGLLKSGGFKLARIEKPGTNTKLSDPSSPGKREMSSERGRGEVLSRRQSIQMLWLPGIWRTVN
jgi:hypothetical protein